MNKFSYFLWKVLNSLLDFNNRKLGGSKHEHVRKGKQLIYAKPCLFINTVVPLASVYVCNNKYTINKNSIS